MASSITQQIGFIILTIMLISGTAIVTMDNVRLKVDKDVSTFYQPHSSMPWIWTVSGREYNKLLNGTTVMGRNLSSIKINTSIEVKTYYDNITNQTHVVQGTNFNITRETHYLKGAVIVDTYSFDGSLDDVNLFPISHLVEVYNATGLYYQYEVKGLPYNGSSFKLDGQQVKMVFGKNMSVEWWPNYRLGWIYSTGNMYVKSEKITSDYTRFNVRLYDPVIINPIIGSGTTSVGTAPASSKHLIRLNDSSLITVYPSAQNYLMCSNSSNNGVTWTHAIVNSSINWTQSAIATNGSRVVVFVQDSTNTKQFVTYSDMASTKCSALNANMQLIEDVKTNYTDMVYDGVRDAFIGCFIDDVGTANNLSIVMSPADSMLWVPSDVATIVPYDYCTIDADLNGNTLIVAGNSTSSDFWNSSELAGWTGMNLTTGGDIAGYGDLVVDYRGNEYYYIAGNGSYGIVTYNSSNSGTSWTKLSTTTGYINGTSTNIQSVTAGIDYYKNIYALFSQATNADGWNILGITGSTDKGKTWIAPELAYNSSGMFNIVRTLFNDSFDRSNSGTVGNGWSECEIWYAAASNAVASIDTNRLELTTYKPGAGDPHIYVSHNVNFSKYAYYNNSYMVYNALWYSDYHTANDFTLTVMFWDNLPSCAVSQYVSAKLDLWMYGPTTNWRMHTNDYAEHNLSANGNWTDDVWYNVTITINATHARTNITRVDTGAGVWLSDWMRANGTYFTGNLNFNLTHSMVQGDSDAGSQSYVDNDSISYYTNGTYIGSYYPSQLYSTYPSNNRMPATNDSVWAVFTDNYGLGDFDLRFLDYVYDINNSVPVWNYNISNTTINENTGEQVYLTNLSDYASDPNFDPYSFSVQIENISQVDCEVYDNSTDWRLNLTPATDWFGLANCTIGLNDSFAYGENRTFFINVDNVVNVESVRISPLYPNMSTNLLGYCNASSPQDLVEYNWTWYVNNITYKSGYSYNYSFCYQESVSVSNVSGTDGSCSQDYGGTSIYDTWTSAWNLDDGGWNNIASPVFTSTFNATYIKPPNVLNNSRWMVGNNIITNIVNYSIPTSCWEHSNINITFVTYGKIGNLTYYCIDDTGLEYVGASIGGAAEFFREEGMWWSIKQGYPQGIEQNLDNITAAETWAFDEWIFSCRAGNATYWSAWKNSTSVTIYPDLNLSLDGNQSNMTYEYGTNANINGSWGYNCTTTPIYLDIIAPLYGINYTNATCEVLYNYTVQNYTFITGTENYSWSNKTYDLRLNQTATFLLHNIKEIISATINLTGSRSERDIHYFDHMASNETYFWKNFSKGEVMVLNITLKTETILTQSSFKVFTNDSAQNISIDICNDGVYDQNETDNLTTAQTISLNITKVNDCANKNPLQIKINVTGLGGWLRVYSIEFDQLSSYYPTDTLIDIANDGVIDINLSGQLAGSLGTVTTFSDGSTSQTLTANTSALNNFTVYVQVPTDFSISSAKFELLTDGVNGSFSEDFTTNDSINLSASSMNWIDNFFGVVEFYTQDFEMHYIYSGRIANRSGNNISRAMITVDDVVPTDGEMTYYLSADNGSNWEEVSNNLEHTFSYPGEVLMWRAQYNTILGDSEGYIHSFNISRFGYYPYNVSINSSAVTGKLYNKTGEVKVTTAVQIKPSVSQLNSYRQSSCSGDTCNIPIYVEFMGPGSVVLQGVSFKYSTLDTSLPINPINYYMNNQNTTRTNVTNMSYEGGQSPNLEINYTGTQVRNITIARNIIVDYIRLAVIGRYFQ